MSNLGNRSHPSESANDIAELRQLVVQIQDSICKGPDSIREHLRKIEEKLENTTTKADLDNLELNRSKEVLKTLRRTIVFIVLGTVVIIAVLIILLSLTSQSQI